MSIGKGIETSTVVWLVLVLSTMVSWWIDGSTQDNARLGSSVVLAVAFFKVHLVGMYFMELKNAPLPLFLAFEAWLVIVGTGLTGTYLWL